MKVEVTSIRFISGLPEVGGSGWNKAAGGKFSTAEFDSDLGIVTLFPSGASAKQRIPLTNIGSMVWGATKATTRE